jgi:hypothetical protein
MTADEFRMLYSIPYNRGLVGARLKKQFVDWQPRLLQLASHLD